MRNVQLYTDGSCSSHLKGKGLGGIGYILYFPDNQTLEQGSKGYYLSNNNRMELIAVLEGLKSLKKPHNVKIITDSQFVEAGIQKLLSSLELPKSEQDLWRKLSLLIQQHKISCSRSSSHPQIEQCHKLANKARETPTTYDLGIIQEVNLHQEIRQLEEKQRQLKRQVQMIQAQITILKSTLEIICENK